MPPAQQPADRDRQPFVLLNTPRMNLSATRGTQPPRRLDPAPNARRAPGQKRKWPLRSEPESVRRQSDLTPTCGDLCAPDQSTSGSDRRHTDGDLHRAGRHRTLGPRSGRRPLHHLGRRSPGRDHIPSHRTRTIRVRKTRRRPGVEPTADDRRVLRQKGECASSGR